MADRLRVAMIGAGNIAQQHLPVLTAHPLCEVVALCDASPEALTATGDRFQIAHRSTHYQDVLARSDVDAVVAAVSHRATVEVAGAFIAAGRPVLLEKPPGMFSTDTARLVELQARHGGIAMVGLNRRFYSSHLMAREWLRAHGPLVTLTVEAHEDLSRMTTSRFRPDEISLMQRRRAYANGIHALDLIRYFGGEVTEVQTHQAAYEHEFPDSFGALLRFAPAAREGEAASGRVAMDFVAPGQHRFDLRTRGAHLESDSPFAGVTLSVRGQAQRRFEPDEDDARFKPGFWKQATAFLEAVRDGRPPAAPAALLPDAYATMRLIDRLFGD